MELADFNWVALAILLIEWYLGHSKAVEANSMIDLVLNLLLSGLRKIGALKQE